jgi:hypothetical protein
MADEIRNAQVQLGTALSQVHAGEDREISRQVREKGEQFAKILYGLLRMTHIHSMDNVVFEQPVQDFRSVLESLCKLLGTVHLVCVEDQVYVNDVRIRFEIASEHVEAVGADLRRHRIGGISFNDVITEKQILILVGMIIEPPARKSPRMSFQRKLNENGMSSIELHGIFSFRMKGEKIHKMDREFKEVYQQSASVIAEAYRNLSANRLPNPLPVRRLANEMIDTSRSASIADLARDHDRRLPHYARHTLMVTNLSLLIGGAAGFSNAILSDLGVAAMFHDVGYSLKEDGYWVPFERHTTAGLSSLMRQRGFHEAKVRRLLAVAEHHRSYNSPKGRPSLFARIIHIADDYDILTRFRPGKGPILSHPDALARMAAHTGKAYDPDLFQVFVNKMGMFPPGSILRLASGRLVVSASGVRNRKTFAKPLCQVVRNADGSRATNRELVDLAGEDRVIKVLQPSA